MRNFEQLKDDTIRRDLARLSVRPSSLQIFSHYMRSQALIFRYKALPLGLLLLYTELPAMHWIRTMCMPQRLWQTTEIARGWRDPRPPSTAGRRPWIPSTRRSCHHWHPTLWQSSWQALWKCQQRPMQTSKIHTASKLGRNAQAMGHWHEGPQLVLECESENPKPRTLVPECPRHHYCLCQTWWTI